MTPKLSQLAASILATGPVTQVADIVVPEIFTPYVQEYTTLKSRLVQSGIMSGSPLLDAFLAGGGLTMNMPSFKDLDNDADNVSTDAADDIYTGGSANSAPLKIGSATEIAVRLSRNQSWSSADLAAALAGEDPMSAIANLVGGYWVRRLQAAFIAVMTGLFANDALASPGGTAVQNDMIYDVSGGAFVDGVTNFSAENFLGAALTMGDSSDELTAVFVHSVVYNRMQNNNLIDFIPDSEGVVNIPTFLGREVIVDDSMPVSSGVYESWLFARGSVLFGRGTPKVPTEVARRPDAGNGGGQEVLFNRTEWCIHPRGYQYAGTSPNGGPSNAATANNLANSAAWSRVYPERKQIKIAKLITRES